MINVKVSDGRSGHVGIVTERGQIVTGDIAFSKFYAKSLALASTNYSVVPPAHNQSFVITAIMLSANKDVGVNGATVNLYASADGPATATQTEIIIIDEIAKQTRSTLTGLNIEVAEGNWINANTDDNVVRVNIAGYYAPIVRVI